MTPNAWTRRRFLGGIALAAGCECEPRGPKPPQIREVGPSAVRGHALRDQSYSTRASQRPERIRVRVAIVGAGVSGVAAAWRLRRAGLREVCLLDLEEDTGGTARAGELPRSSYPMGAHYLPSPHPSFRGIVTLLDDLGVTLRGTDTPDLQFDPRMVCAAPLERHRMRGMWQAGLYPAAGQTADDEAQWQRWTDHLEDLERRQFGSDGRRLFDLPVARSSTDLRHLDRISMAEYLDRMGLTSWRLRWTVDYACRDDYGCRLDQTSAFAALHHALARGLEDSSRDRVTLTWPQGNHYLVSQMAKRAELGERLRLATAAIAIDPDRGEIRGYDLEHAKELVVQADVVLWAAPRFVLPYVLPDGVDPLRRGALQYAPWLVAGVQTRQRPAGVGAPLAWDNVAIDADHLGYVVAHHTESMRARVHPEAVLVYYEPFCGSLDRERAWLLSASSDELSARVIASLEGMHPGISHTVSHVDLARWGHGMIRPVPGLLFGPELALAAAPIGRVIPCAADVGGLPLFEQAFANGVSAAESALARIGTPTTSVL